MQLGKPCHLFVAEYHFYKHNLESKGPGTYLPTVSVKNLEDHTPQS